MSNNLPAKYQGPQGVVPRSMQELQQLGQACAASGFFADSKQAAQAIIKIQAGAELGLPPVQAMTSINVIKGRITLSAGLMAALLKRAGYKFRVQWQQNPTGCTIHMRDQAGEELGESSFSIEDAKKAGLGGDNWRKYPRNMCYARAISNAARWYAPEVLTGVYLQEEMEAVDEVVPSQPIPVVGRGGPAMPSERVMDALPVDDAHGSDAWQAENRRLRGLLAQSGISEEERKMVLSCCYGVDSSKLLTGAQLHDIGEALYEQPTSDDMAYQRMIAGHGNSSPSNLDDMRRAATTPWRAVFLAREIASHANEEAA